ncbi:MAG: hypothetical protein RJQ08_13455 [Salinisphaeraceae bacterium]
MSINLSIRDFRGVARADIDLAPLALIAGQNEHGKTSLAQAARAALAGQPIPVPGVLKKQAGLLVREGADGGYVKISDGGDPRIIEWPKAAITGNEDAPQASGYAVGLTHLLDLDDKARATALADYVDTAPNEGDLIAAMFDAGYSDKAALQVWKAIDKDGWDTTHGKAREHSTKLKGQWEGATGEKYGAKKAAGWTPANLPEETDRDKLAAAVDKARAAVKAAVGKVAVSDDEIARLKARAEADLPDGDSLQKLEDKLQAQRDDARQKLAELPEPLGDGPATADCPACGATLSATTENGLALHVHDEKADKAAAKKAEKADAERAKLKELVQELTQEIGNLQGQIRDADQARKAAEDARKRLAEIDGADKGQGGDAVAEAESAEAEALAALTAFDAKALADKLHADITKNDKLAAVLAPDGLRRRKLADGLESLNAKLAAASRAASWPIVRLDDNLKAHYGTRPLWAASASGQWRARVVLQTVMAMIDQSAAVVIDEADILDFHGRNGLIELLRFADMPALVCMTVNKPALVPDLAANRIGQSYWIEKGECRLAHAEEIAA